MKRNLLLLSLAAYSIGMTIAYIHKVQHYNDEMMRADEAIEVLTDRLTVAEDTLTLVFGEEWNPENLVIDEITVTPYTSRPQETDSTPYHTSIGEHVRPGGAAFTNDMGLDYGQNVLIVGQGIYTKNDHMPGHGKKADIWVGNLKAAQYIGKTQRTAIWLKH